MLFQPAVYRVHVRRVRDDQVAVLVESIDDQVVDDPAGLVREQRVLRVTATELVDVVGEHRLQQVARGRPLDLELAHVRDVEDAGIRAHRLVLLDHALVLDRHLPSGKRDHARAERNVTVVKRRPPERLHRGDANPRRVSDTCASTWRQTTGRKERSPADGVDRASDRVVLGLHSSPERAPAYLPGRSGR